MTERSKKHLTGIKDDQVKVVLDEFEAMMAKEAKECTD